MGRSLQQLSAQEKGGEWWFLVLVGWLLDAFVKTR